MIVPPTIERLVERDRAAHAFLAAGGDFDCLVALDRRVRRGHRSDWPGRTELTPEWRQEAPAWAWPRECPPPGKRWGLLCPDHGPLPDWRPCRACREERAGR